MRIRDLFEAPLGDMTVPEFPARSSFRPEDQKILKSPKAQIKLRRIFERIPQTIDLVIIDRGRPISVYELTEREDDSTMAWAEAKSQIPELPSLSTPDATMLVLTNNEGSERIPLTPWIIAHRLGHAAVYDPFIADIVQNSLYAISDITSYFYDGWGIPRLATIYHLGTMRSARNKNLNSADEFVFECFAQYLITGRVTIKPYENGSLRTRLDVHIDRGEKTIVLDEHHLNDINSVIANAVKTMNRDFAKVMAALAGKVVTI